MKINRVDLIHINLPMKQPFRTGCGASEERHLVLVKMHADGMVGTGEVSSNFDPHYSYETTGTCIHVLRDFFIPRILKTELRTIEDFLERMNVYRGHNMARSGLQTAFWDLLSKQQGIPLCRAIGGQDKKRIETGVSIGIQDTVEQLLREAERFADRGYRRLKIKIRPGYDIEPMTAVRRAFPDVPTMADANSSYTLEHVEVFKRLDDLDLMMIEQPLSHDDIVDHRKLQEQIRTPICLDESIHHAEDARKAIELGSCRIVNIKLSRVGGPSEAKRIQALCAAHGVPVWCGSMLESGIGEAFNIAVSTLPNYTIIGDVAPSDRYFTDDVISPFIELNRDGTIDVPSTPGLGVTPDEEKIKRYTVERIVVA